MFAKTKLFMAVATGFCMLAATAQDEFEFLEEESTAEAPAEDAAGEEAVGEDATEGESDAAGKQEEQSSSAKNSAKPFYSLMRCTRAQGNVEIMRPGASGWQRVEEGRYYPMGAVIRAVRTADVLPDMPAAEFEFGKDAKIAVKESAEFATRSAVIGEQVRTVVLRSGVVNVIMPRNMPKDAMSVAAPHFICSDLAGESVFAYRTTADGDETIVRVVTGSLALKGAHYSIPEMSAADRLRIRTTGDDLETFLRGETGSFKVKLDQGIERRVNFETGKEEDRAAELEYLITPRCAVKLFRRRSSVGDRMIVTTLTFDAKGKIQNRRVFVEGLYNINSGELVLKQVDVAASASEKAAGETTAVEATEEELTEETADESAEAVDESSTESAGEDIF